MTEDQPLPEHMLMAMKVACRRASQKDGMGMADAETCAALEKQIDGMTPFEQRVLYPQIESHLPDLIPELFVKADGQTKYRK